MPGPEVVEGLRAANTRLRELLAARDGNVPTERAAHLVGMLTGQGVSAGFVDRANARLAGQLTGAGFGEAMQAALMSEPVLTADESPVEVITPAKDPQTGEPVPGAPHVMVLRTPDERLVWVSALDSRRHDEVIASLRTFTGYLIVDGYLAYQKLLPCTRDHDHREQEQECVGGLLAGLQQCCQHYAEPPIMPMVGSSVLVGGGARAGVFGIFRGPRGMPRSDQGLGSALVA